ncbi:MAG: hypothetical protein JXB29_12425 [Sedimentisphaerales bacterium]|nr:hypothetical protein [Sedimentisphaerales bacterium]
MATITHKTKGLTIVEQEYLKVVRLELRQAIKEGEPQRAMSFAKEAARLQRKKLASKEGHNER